MLDYAAQYESITDQIHDDMYRPCHNDHQNDSLSDSSKDDFDIEEYLEYLGDRHDY